MLFLQFMGWVTTFLPLLGLLVSLRFTNLAKAAPTIAGGFGVMLAVSIVQRIINPMFSHFEGTSSSPGFAAFMSRVVLSSSLMHVFSLTGWLLVIYGLYATFTEVSKKLALAHLSQQSEQNTQTTPISLQSQQTQSPYTQQSFREESHASAFVSPTPGIASAPAVPVYRAADAVESEQPAPLVPLGSARQ